MEENFGVTILDSPIKPLHCKKEYRVIKLQNGLKALLTSDIPNLNDAATGNDADESFNGIKEEDTVENVEKKENEEEVEEDLSIKNKKQLIKNANEIKYLCTASLCIGVGHFENPSDTPSLMHFLEHMIFMGSEKYPEENGFDNFIKKYEGSKIVCTKYANTTFSFSIQETHFEKALDMFANIFISPIIKEEARHREGEAFRVDFLEYIGKERLRRAQFLASMADENHPLSYFNIESEESLQLEISEEELNSKLHDIRSKYYTAQNMTLAVQANESLDKLQEMVTQIFSEIPNIGLQSLSGEQIGFPFHQETFHRFYKMNSEIDSPALELNFVLPSLVKCYENKSFGYISHCIEYQGYGSIYYYLTKRDWAYGVRADIGGLGYARNSYSEMFSIQVFLSNEGLDHLKEIIEVIFQYLALMKKEGPNDRIFSDIQQIKQITFDRPEELYIIDNFVALSEEMMYYPSKHILTRDNLLYKYDSSAIEYCLSNLNIDNCNIFFYSKKIEEQDLPLQEEKWHGTKYYVEDIPEEWIKEWESSPSNTELHLPSKNEFICDDFEIFKWNDASKSPPLYPQAIMKTDKGTLWFKQDCKFNLPRVFCFIYFYVDGIEKCPEVIVMFYIIINLINEHIREAFHSIIAANYEFSLTPEQWGVTLMINGFNQKLFKCLEVILSQIEDFEKYFDDAKFEKKKQDFIRNYQHITVTPNCLSSDLRLQILQEFRWSASEKLKAIANLKKESLTEFRNKLLFKKNVDMLVQGNITEEEAKKLFKLVVPGPTNSSCNVNCPEMKFRRLEPGEHVIRAKSISQVHPNIYTLNYYQGERSSFRTKLVSEFVDTLINEIWMNNISIEEELEYCFFAYVDPCGISGLLIEASSQADISSVAYGDEKIENFIKEFSEKLRNFSDEEMEEFRGWIRTGKLNVHDTMFQEVYYNWGEITSGTYMFSRAEQQLQMIPSITLEEISSYFDNLVFPINNENFRKLSIQIVGSSSASNEISLENDTVLVNPVEEALEFLQPTEQDLNSGLSQNQFICDFPSFIDSLSFFEDSKREIED